MYYKQEIFIYRYLDFLNRNIKFMFEVKSVALSGVSFHFIYSSQKSDNLG